MVQTVKSLIGEREARYGEFYDQAMTARLLHDAINDGLLRSGKSASDLSADQLEALNMIVNKLSRIINGDPYYADSWRDIAGYATLVADRLEKYERTRDFRPDTTGTSFGGSTEEAGVASSGDSRPPGGGDGVRRMPVSLEVQDGAISTEAQT